MLPIIMLCGLAIPVIISLCVSFIAEWSMVARSAPVCLRRLINETASLSVPVTHKLKVGRSDRGNQALKSDDCTTVLLHLVATLREIGAYTSG